MDLHHNAVRLGGRFLEQRLEHVHDELHWRVVVVQEDHTVQGRLFGLVFDAFLDRPIRVMSVRRAVGHT